MLFDLWETSIDWDPALGEEMLTSIARYVNGPDAEFRAR
jgi:hypothetical protein